MDAREFVKRAGLENSIDEQGSPAPGPEPIASQAAVVEIPTEPFPCPACGQMLAPTCRVCVACRHAIDPAEIARPQKVAAPAVPIAGPQPASIPVRYPWPIFFAVLGITFLVGMVLSGLMPEQRAQWVMWGVQALAGFWVFYDAIRQRVPRPLRWGVGTILLTTIILPWYLARRNKPQSTVPCVEAEVGRVTRFLAFALAVFFVFSAIVYLVQGPPPGSMDLQRILMPK